MNSHLVEYLWQQDCVCVCVRVCVCLVVCVYGVGSAAGRKEPDRARVCPILCTYLAELRQAHVHARPEAGAQVGGTGEDVAQVLVPHEFPAPLLDQMLHLVGVTRQRVDQSHASYRLRGKYAPQKFVEIARKKFSFAD